MKFAFLKQSATQYHHSEQKAPDTDNTKLLHLSVIRAPIFFPTAFFMGFVNELMEPGPQMCRTRASSRSHTLHLCLAHAYKQQSVSRCLSFYSVFPFSLSFQRTLFLLLYPGPALTMGSDWFTCEPMSARPPATMLHHPDNGLNL